MMKLRKHIRENTILYRMIGAIMLIAAITVCVLTFLLSRAAEESLQEQISLSQQKNLQRIANTMDFRAEYASYLMQQANRDKTISQMFYSMQGKDGAAALKALSELRQSVKQLHSIYIYNEAENLLYCSSGALPSLITNPDQFDDTDFIKILSNIGDYPKYAPILRRVAQEKPNGQVYGEFVYTYLLYNAYSSGTIHNVMAFNFHSGWMGDALNFIASEPNAAEAIWIVDQSRQIVYSDSGNLIGTYGDVAQFPDAIFDEPSGYLISGSGKDRTMLVYATPKHTAYNQWTFVSVSDYTELIAPISRLRGGAYLIALMVLIASAIISIILSGRLYRAVKQTIDKMESLEEEQARKQVIERGLYLRKLLQGDLHEEPSKIKDTMRQLGIAYDMDRDNRVLLICVDYMNSYLLRFHDKLEEVDKAIETAIQSKIDANYPEFLLINMRKGLWVICVPAQEAVEMNSLQRVFQQINDQLYKLLEVTVSIAVSTLGHSVGDIPYLYAEALNTLSFRFLVGQNHLLTPEETNEYGKEKFVYPHEIEEKLIACVFTGKAQEAQGYYEQFVDQIRFCSVVDNRMAFILLANAVKRASSNTITEISSILMEFDQFYHKLQTLETLDEVNQMFLHLIWEITEKTQGYARQKYEQLIAQMKDYVAKNYGNSSLSMNDVADHVDMSAAYLGRLFKQLTGITFTEYLTKFRLDTACQLLINSPKTVNEISDAVGFTNSSYFYIVFKKNLGVTPNQYRKQNE